MFEPNNSKISSSCSFYKETSHSLEKKPISFLDKKLGNKTNYFPNSKKTLPVDKTPLICPIEEFPGTWKKGAPKINSSKLPSAFGTIFQKTVKNNKFELLLKKLSFLRDPIRNIENIVNIQEYKQAVQLLSPLKLEEKRQIKTPKDSKFSRKSHKRPKKSNPLEPLRSYMENFTKVSKEMLFDLPSNISSILQRTSLINSKLRLEELITISIKRSGKGVGCFKKMLHVPGIQLYGLKEVPIKNPEMRKNLKEWISIWQSIYNEKNSLVKVTSTFWNSPEGNVSIVMELMNAGSLQGLLENMGGLHEDTILLISKKVLHAVKIMHEIGRYYEGSLTIEQILFDREGNVKISLGLSTSLEKPIGHNFPLHNPVFANAQSKELIRKAQANDVYNIGLICLMAAVGDSTLLGFTEEEIEKVQKENSNQTKKGLCCFLHSEKSLFSRKISILEVLEKKGFSKEFIAFLCQSLRFNWQERGNIDKIIDRLKIAFKNKKNCKNDLKELIKVGLFWESHQENDEKMGIKFLEKLLEGMRVVMPNCENWFNREEYKPYLTHLDSFSGDNDVFKNLEKELGVKKEIIFEKMKKVFHEFGFMISEEDRKYNVSNEV